MQPRGSLPASQGFLGLYPLGKGFYGAWFARQGSCEEPVADALTIPKQAPADGFSWMQASGSVTLTFKVSQTDVSKQYLTSSLNHMQAQSSARVLEEDQHASGRLISSL